MRWADDAAMVVAIEDFDAADERRRESLFGLGNGALFVRACPPEIASEDEHHYPGSYAAGLYDRRLVSIGDRTLGHDALVNLPNWALLTFRIEGDAEWFSLRRGEVLAYRHVLDMRRGLACREMLVRDARGRRTRLREQRLVSMWRPSIAALRWQLTPENWSGQVELRAALDIGEGNHNTDGGTLGIYRHLETAVLDERPADMLLLTTRTRHSGIRIAVAARARTDAPARCHVIREAGRIAQHMIRPCAAGETLAIEKVAAIVTERDPAIADPKHAALGIAADAPDFAALCGEHERAWARLWDRAGLDAAQPELRRELSLHIFHLLQTVSPHTVHLDAGMPARGWQEAYHGQVFWDEIFAFPFLSHRFPEIARALLLYRYRRLARARRAAREAGHAGAMFPWRSGATGSEQTPSFQLNPLSGHLLADDTRLQRHIGAGIAHTVWHHYLATRDELFLAEYGAEMLIEIARFWASIARHDPDSDRYDIGRVIGPDEYHNAYPGAAEPGMDNNAYTNVMAAAALLRACTALECLPPRRRRDLAGVLELAEHEPPYWRRVARRLRLCFDADGVLMQFAGFDRLKPWTGAPFPELQRQGRIDRVLEARGDSVDAWQITKQGDVLMLLYLLAPDELTTLIGGMGYAFDESQAQRTARYYLSRMTHESSLSRVVCAGALAASDPEASWDFFQRALRIDRDASETSSASEGLHLGAMAGTLDVLQRHYLGARVEADALTIAPSPPAALGPVRMRLTHCGQMVTLDWDGATLRVCADPANRDALAIRHAGGLRRLAPGGELVAYASR